MAQRRKGAQMNAGFFAAVGLFVTGMGLQGCTLVRPIPARGEQSAPARPSPHARIPLHFEPTQQVSGRPGFLSRGPGYVVYLTPGETIFHLRLPASATSSDPLAVRHLPEIQTTVLRQQLLGARREAGLTGVEGIAGKVHYLIGSPSQWRTNLPLFSRVEAKSVYPGINLVYYGNPQQLEYDFVVAPGADPRQIRMGFTGQSGSLRIDAEGNLVVPLVGGEVVQRRPLIYQQIDDEKVLVAGEYQLHEGKSQQEVGFALAAYDATRPLVIDPVLAYSTYLGSATGGASGHAIAVDADGSVYITGSAGAGFPTQDPYQPTETSGDAVITKFSPDGNSLIFSTYLGGNLGETGTGIAVDTAGNVHVVGLTASSNFPTQNAAQGTVQGLYDGFVSKLSATGDSLVYSTYLGGSSFDEARAVAVDAAGNAYVVGYTESSNFPTQNAIQAASGGSNGDGFVTSLSATGALNYSTYLGGHNTDALTTVAVDNTGAVYVGGGTFSTNFPTANPYQGSPASSNDAVVAKLSAGGNALVYSTHLGGNDGEVVEGIAVDKDGSAYVVGQTFSTDFPTLNPFQASKGGNHDAFVTKLVPAGNALAYSTYLGGSVLEFPSSIAVDGAGSAYVTGTTASTDFPIVNAVQATYVGDTGPFGDAFVTKLTPTGNALVYSTYLGGSRQDFPQGIALRPAAVSGKSFLSAYVAGQTGSADFPTMHAYQPVKSCLTEGCPDMFITKLTVGDKEAQDSVGAGGAVTTDVGADGTSIADPIEVSVTSPNAGAVTVAFIQDPSNALNLEADITAPAATFDDPLEINFHINLSLAFTAPMVLRNGVPVPRCSGAPGIASPDPCVASATFNSPPTDLIITILTSQASLWTVTDANSAAACPLVARGDCQPALTQKSQIQLKRGNTADKDAVKWKWVSSGTVDTADFGDPTTLESFNLCVYSNDELRLAMVAPAGGTCGTRDCWQMSNGGFKYSDNLLSPLGLKKMSFKAGPAGKGKIAVSGKGTALPDTTFPLSTPVVVQLLGSEGGPCWEATYSTFRTSDNAQFKAKSD